MADVATEPTTIPVPEAPLPPAANKPQFPSGVAGRILKAKVWAAQNKALLVGGGIATTGLIAALVAGAIPLWKKVIQPRLTQMKKDHAAGKKVSKRSVEDVYVDELIADEEFVSFLEELAEHMDLE